MPIHDRHPEYVENLPSMIKALDAYEGSKNIKARTIGSTSINPHAVEGEGKPGSAYLLPLKGQSNGEYASYRDRALYHNVSGRATDGMVGVISRLPPGMAGFKGKYERYKSDITNDGISIEELIKQCALNILLFNRACLMVDAPSDGGQAALKSFHPLDVINWDYDEETDQLNYVVIESNTYVNDPDDKYSKVEKKVFYELHIDDSGFYAVSVHTEKVTRGKKIEYDVITREPMIRNNRIKYIPFYFLNSSGVNTVLTRSIMMDIIEINLSHYMSSADLEHGRHFTALPTPVITGINSESDIKIGSTQAIALTDPQAKAFFLEFTGQGLSSLENALREKEQQMSSMSARLIDQNRKGSEAAETVRLRYSGESNVLNGVVGTIENAMNACLAELTEWNGDRSVELKVTLNRDFMDSSLSAQSMRVLMEMYLEGAIDIDAFVFNMKRAEMFSPDKTDEEIREALSNLQTNYRKQTTTPTEND